MLIRFRSIAPAFILLLSLATAAAAELKVGTVDMARVFKEYAKTKDAEAKVNEAKNAAKKEYDERAAAYKSALDEVNKLTTQLETPALSADSRRDKAKERDEKIATIQKMEREINEFRQAREQQLQQQVQRLREGILEEITDVVMDEVKSRGLDLVFDRSGPSLNGFSPILFSHDRGDFTGAVVAVLNKAPRAPSASR